MKNRFSIVSLLVITGLLLASCKPAPASQPTAGASAQATTAPASTPTLQPTATSQPGKALLIAPPGTDAQPVQALLAELSGAAGLTLETREALQKEDLKPEDRIVVFLALPGALTPANLSELTGAAPQTQFIAVSSADLPAAGNLTVIRQRAENQAFVAGFITVLLSFDFRAAGLLPADGPLGGALQDAFTNGARYFCGVCAPGWPLNLYYPQVAALPAASDGPTWQAAAAGFFDNQKVEVYYLSPEAARPEVFDYLSGKTQADKTVLVVGAQTPPDSLRQQWAATVRFDLTAALRQAWTEAAAGKGGQGMDAPLVVDNPNPGLLGEGRMRLVKNLLEEIKAGTIYPLTVPAQ